MSRRAPICVQHEELALTFRIHQGPAGCADRVQEVPIPVFDMNGDRVLPAEYEEHLKGALVDVSVKITNITYRQYGFFANIALFVILAPPGYEPTVETAVVKKKLKYPTPSHLKKFVATSSK